MRLIVSTATGSDFNLPAHDRNHMSAAVHEKLSHIATVLTEVSTDLYSLV